VTSQRKTIEIEKIKEIVDWFRKNEFLTTEDRSAIFNAVDSERYETLDNGQTFYLWDALGCYGELSLYAQHVYGACEIAWSVRDVKKEKMLELFKELRKNLSNQDVIGPVAPHLH
jgi:hypothetical protein